MDLLKPYFVIPGKVRSVAILILGLIIIYFLWIYPYYIFRKPFITDIALKVIYSDSKITTNIPEYHIWLEILDVTDYKEIEINGYVAEGQSTVMAKVISEIVIIPKEISVIEGEVNLPSRLSPSWNRIYFTGSGYYIHLISGFKPNNIKHRLSLTLSLRNDKTGQAKELTLPVHTF